MLVVYQDTNRRTIHVILPVIVFLLALVINYYTSYLTLSSLWMNALFILINIAGLILYSSLKSRKIINPINKMLGIGDVLFFMAITPLFNLKPFILFFVLGLVFSLLIHLSYSLFKKVKTIPLAGYLALFLILNVASHYTINKSFLF